jgi:hypothetical protein
MLGKDIKVVHLRSTISPDLSATEKPAQQIPPASGNSLLDIEVNWQNIEPKAAQIIQNAHQQYSQVFDNNLSEGYNGAFGPHTCRLNWASDRRPTANPVRVVNYSHNLKQLHQAVCDELTNQNVLGVPQHFNVNVQHVCPSFLRRKPKAKNKPNHLLTTQDVRLVVNFSPLNDHLKNIPSVRSTTNDILVALGRWKHIITFDLHQGFFQNHMALEDGKWLGIATPFGGIRFMRRSGQGLLGQSEELEELLSKILQSELQAGHCCKIADDIFVGGQTQLEAAQIYCTILQKLHAANLKISGSKTHIFPTSTDVLGWIWKEGGRLLPSPHRQLALKNTKQEDIVTVKDMRSWMGLYKTLLIATPHLATILDPFDTATANRDSKEKIDWTPQIAQAFATAKDHIKNIKELYLPTPNDQLLIVPDGSQKTPGIGHVLYALVDGTRKPVRYHSVKLPDNCKKWSPCEIEALAFATGIQSEMDLIKESTKPLLIAPDSSPVKDAVGLIKRGKFSASARMNSFITNINRVPVEVVHASGKAHLNKDGDFQSRNPSTCQTALCSICNFITEQISATVNPNAKLAAIHDSSLYNTKAWAVAQSQNIACKTALDHLKTGKQPSKKSGSVLTEIRRYCTIATIGRDNCLTVPAPPSLTNASQLDKIIIPTPLLPALLWHMHNALNHPSKTQLRSQFDRMFYGILVQQHLDQIYQECYQCKLTMPLPAVNTNHSQCTEVDHPGSYFHADIIRREKQKIFILRDNFSSMAAAMIIHTEQAQDMKSAIIQLTSSLRIASHITVRTDSATGFQALQNDVELRKLGITICIADPLNKNSNAVADKACLELGQELTKLQPQGGPISDSTLATAVFYLNTKVRRKDKLTAIEIHHARNQETYENLQLDDSKLRENQLQGRQLQPAKIDKQAKVQAGDTVVLTHTPAKHTVRDTYLVTAAQPTAVTMQKLIIREKSQLRPKTYTTKPELITVIHRATEVPISKYEHSELSQQSEQQNTVLPPTQWSPFNPDFYNQHQEDDIDEQDTAQPTVLATMHSWLHQQRHQAAASRLSNRNALQQFLPPPPPPPQPQQLPPSADPIVTEQRPLRLAKVAALAAIITRSQSPQSNKSSAIPQLEGAEPTPDTSLSSTSLHNPLSPKEPWSPTASSHASSLQWDSFITIHSDKCPSPSASAKHSSSPTPTSLNSKSIDWDDLHLPYRRATFGGFPGPKWITRRPKLCIPDYTVWQNPSAPLPYHMC